MPVYVVHWCDGTGNDRTLHRNMLFPLSLPLSETLNEPEQAVTTDEDVSDITRKRVTRVTPAIRDDDSDSDEEHYLQFKDPRFFYGYQKWNSWGDGYGQWGQWHVTRSRRICGRWAGQSWGGGQWGQWSPVWCSTSSRWTFGQRACQSCGGKVFIRDTKSTIEEKYQGYMPANALLRWHLSVVPTDSFCSRVESMIWCLVEQVSRKATGDL